MKRFLPTNQGEGEPEAPIVLITDNPDRAGDFVADAEELVSTILSGEEVQKIYLTELGTAATRSSILQAFDQGAST